MSLQARREIRPPVRGAVADLDAALARPIVSIIAEDTGDGGPVQFAR